MIRDPDTYALFLECHRLFRYESGLLIRKISMGRAKQGMVAGCIGNYGYRLVMVSKKLRLHSRLVFFMSRGYFPEEIDHIDGNKVNDKIENLRPATRSQNACNIGARANSKSGVKGVYWHKQSHKWHASGMLRGKKYSLGYFLDKDAAANAMRNFREQYHKEFANHE